MPPLVFFELGVIGAEKAAHISDIVILIDALRASSTIVTALANGIKSIVPVSSIEECIGEITAGEIAGRKQAFLSHDNSPIEFNNIDYKGKRLVLTTSNGTKCINAVVSCSTEILLIGSLLNTSVVANEVYKNANANDKKKNITLLIAGRKNGMAQEDLIVASEIFYELKSKKIAGDIMPVKSKDFLMDFKQSESGQNLLLLGKEADVVFCAQKDIFNIVPIYKNGEIIRSQ